MTVCSVEIVDENQGKYKLKGCLAIEDWTEGEGATFDQDTLHSSESEFEDIIREVEECIIVEHQLDQVKRGELPGSSKDFDNL